MAATVAAILLAAGAARRMGSCKQLLPLDGMPVIGRCLETLLAAGIEEPVVVVGPDGAEVARAAKAYPVRVVVNPDPAADMAASVRIGCQALPPEADGVVVALCDYPLVTAETIRLLVDAQRNQPERIVIPCHDGRRGHPTLFPRRLLRTMTPPLTMRDLVRSAPDRVAHLAVSDNGILLDMDTPEDYRRILEHGRHRLQV